MLGLLMITCIYTVREPGDQHVSTSLQNLNTHMYSQHHLTDFVSLLCSAASCLFSLFWSLDCNSAVEVKGRWRRWEDLQWGENRGRGFLKWKVWLTARLKVTLRKKKEKELRECKDLCVSGSESAKEKSRGGRWCVDKTFAAVNIMFLCLRENRVKTKATGRVQSSACLYSDVRLYCFLLWAFMEKC